MELKLSIINLLLIHVVRHLPFSSICMCYDAKQSNVSDVKLLTYYFLYVKA